MTRLHLGLERTFIDVHRLSSRNSGFPLGTVN